jgi:hypothetical protein
MINKLNAKNGTYAIESPMCQKHFFGHTISNPGKGRITLNRKGSKQGGQVRFENTD